MAEPLAILIAARDEEARIGATVEALRRAFPDAEVVVADDEHLLHLVNSRIRTIPGVYRTETFVYLKLTKQTYDWGAR